MPSGPLSLSRDRPVSTQTARTESMRPVVGVTANVLLPQPGQPIFCGKTLHYAEEELLGCVARAGGLPVVLPVSRDPDSAREAAQSMDALLIAGGRDVCPERYGEVPRRPEWAGCPERDAHELRLVGAFLAADKPVLGVCRGHQILNVAFGGSLHQDVVEDGVAAHLHRDPEVYDRLQHGIHLLPGMWLHSLYGVGQACVNSVHHQAIRRVGDGLEVVARSAEGIVESVRSRRHRWAVGVQWHPEWITDADVEAGLLPPRPLFREFLSACFSR